MQILIAEDERVSALRLRRALEKLGHEVTVAEDGERAWQVIRDEGASPGHLRLDDAPDGRPGALPANPRPQ